jgi:hypothetical protein
VKHIKMLSLWMLVFSGLGVAYGHDYNVPYESYECSSGLCSVNYQRNQYYRVTTYVLYQGYWDWRCVCHNHRYYDSFTVRDPWGCCQQPIWVSIPPVLTDAGDEIVFLIATDACSTEPQALVPPTPWTALMG